ncbi:MAG: hypothetical protein IJR77_00440 [Bacteroidales bacterium]|nr:hypothetical protein [Bacteroidales bacterium]
MKKFILVIAAVLGLAVVASAQPRALGVRVGWGGELSYQHTLGAENFLEVDAGWGANAISVGAAYDFQIAPLGPFGFYAGPAAHVWIGGSEEQNNLVLGVGAQLGLEYMFDGIPLQLSLDWKPLFTLVPATGFGWQSFGLGIRYAF